MRRRGGRWFNYGASRRRIHRLVLLFDMAIALWRIYEADPEIRPRSGRHKL